jgi:hypothetical protein
MGRASMYCTILNLIHETRHLLEEEGAILASPEDAAYFRTKASAKAIPHAKTFCPPKEEKQRGESIRDHHNHSKISEKPNPNILLQQSTSPNVAPPTEQKTEIEPIKKQAPSPQLLFSQLRTIIAHIAPALPIINQIPSDEKGRKISTRWKTKNQSAPISILSAGELPEHKAFLEEVSLALDVYFGPAKSIDAETIEKEKQWESFLSAEGLKLIVICDFTLWQLPHLMQFYKETPQSNSRTLGKTPLFLLPDLSLYLKDPQLKRSLWKALCQRLS